jgi:hypothetical protein
MHAMFCVIQFNAENRTTVATRMRCLSSCPASGNSDALPEFIPCQCQCYDIW